MMAATLVAAPLALAEDGPTVDRASGADRFATSAAISARTFTDPGAVDVVYLGTGHDHADALAAGTAAARLGGPVMLTLRTSVPQPVADEIMRLAPSRVVLTGGVNAIGQEVADQLNAMPGNFTVDRLGGASRFATAAMLAADAWPEGADVVFLATAFDHADALAGVPAAALRDAPLLLATQSSLTPATRDAIVALDPDEVVVLGGRAAIGDEVLAEVAALGPDVSRISGANRFATADAIARQNFVGAREVFIAEGGGFADALGGGAAVARDQGVLLLSTGNQLPPGTASVLADLNPRRVTVLGGTAALSDDVVAQIRQALARSTALPPGSLPDLMVSGAPTPNHTQALYAAQIDGSVEALTSPPSGYADLSTSWSPDGRRLAFVRISQGQGVSPNPTPYVMDFVQGPRSLRQLTAFEDCEGTHLTPTWRQVAPGEQDALLLACSYGPWDDPDRVDLRVAPLTGSATDVVVPDGVAYTGARWAPDGRLSVLVRVAEDDYELRILDETDWTTGGAGETLTDQIDGASYFHWIDSQGGPMVFHVHTEGDDQVLYGTMDGTTLPELFRGELDDAAGKDWEIADAHADHGVILRTRGTGGSSGRDVADIVDFEGEVTRLRGVGEYNSSRANVLTSPQFLGDGVHVVVGEARHLGDSGEGFTRISDASIELVNLDTGARSGLLTSFAFIIPDAVNPVGRDG